MKSPEIDPELHGLLDEVVHDPRSALRRTPRRALMEWFANPTAAHARPVDTTTAERHLVAVYKESLAAIFTSTAVSLRMRAPLRSHPWRDVDGDPILPVEIGRLMRAKAARAVDFRACWSAIDGVFLQNLQACAGELQPDRANVLARLGAQLVPSDSAWFAVALTIPDLLDPEPIGIFQRLAFSARQPHRRHDSLSQLAVRMVAHDWLPLAREQYERILADVPEALEARCYAFNLSLFLGDESSALEHSRHLASRGSQIAPLREAAKIIADWTTTRDPREVRRVMKSAGRIVERLAPQALVLTEALQ